jgi:hypothetical protein
VFTEIATLAGTPGTDLILSIDTAHAGRVVTQTINENDGSADGFTGTMTFTTPGGTVSTQFGGSNNYNASNTRAGQSGVENGDLAITASTDSALTTSGGGSWENFGNVVGLTYSTFGDWGLTACSNTASCTPTYAGTYAGASAGNSLTSSMPTTGTATYTGGAEGYVQQPAGTNALNVGQFYGTASLTANFATDNITGSITNITSYNVKTSNATQTSQGTVNDINLSASISGSTYTGQATASSTVGSTGAAGTAFNISGASGTVTGGFYGPSAQETAGTFYLAGGANGTNLVGSFGAKK